MTDIISAITTRYTIPCSSLSATGWFINRDVGLRSFHSLILCFLLVAFGDGWFYQLWRGVALVSLTYSTLYCSSHSATVSSFVLFGDGLARDYSGRAAIIGILTPFFRAVASASLYPASTWRATPRPGSFVRTRFNRTLASAVPSATETWPA